MEFPKSNFSEWYNEIIEFAELTDKRYPVKGMNIWMPYGFSIMKNIDEMIRKTFLEDSYEEVMFPSLISRPMFEVEFEHIKGFEKELFWIAKGGRETQEEDLAMRPTSESAIYPMFKLWIRDHGDLPKRIFQIVQVFRYETKHTRPFMRSRDIHFIECHTAHETFNDAEEQMNLYRREWDHFTRYLCIPYLEIRRPDWDKFPGAMYTIAFDTLMPSGRTLQVGTIHQYGTNFAMNYEVKYAKENGESEFVNQTTFGMSERLVAALVGIHGDDKGLILPPKIAPIQIVVVPIGKMDKKMELFIEKIENKLQKLGFRFKTDTDDRYTPGFKFNQWEMKGVPIRIELGNREIENDEVTVSIRTEKGRQKLKTSELENLNKFLEKVESELYEKAKKSLTDGLSGKSSSTGESSIRLVSLCDDRECARVVENKFDLDMMGTISNQDEQKKCEVCGKDGRTSLLSKPY